MGLPACFFLYFFLGVIEIVGRIYSPFIDERAERVLGFLGAGLLCRLHSTLQMGLTGLRMRFRNVLEVTVAGHVATDVLS